MINRIEIFDSLTHPTISGNWILPDFENNCKIDNLLKEMETYNISNAFAVGMKGIGSYSEANYSEFIMSRTDRLLPIAFLDLNEFSNISSIKKKIKYLKLKSYKGVKLHPRIGNFNLSHPLLVETIKAANDENLIVLFCTYFYDKTPNVLTNNIENLLELLIKIPEEKIILLHSGSVRVLEMMEIARSFKNVLLDLSFTLIKYQGSSLDLDIQFLFNNFDKRICIGSDYPELRISHLRSRFNYFAKYLNEQKAINIANKNILDFIKF